MSETRGLPTEAEAVARIQAVRLGVEGQPAAERRHLTAAEARSVWAAIRPMVEGSSARPGRWWRVLEGDGSLWMETSVELEARSEAQAGRTLRRLWVGEGRSEWRDEAW